jgi:hypothetical protein
MPKGHPELIRAWLPPEKDDTSNSQILGNPRDVIRLQLEVCLREAEKSEERLNYEAAEAFYMHALSIDEFNAGDSCHKPSQHHCANLKNIRFN